MKTAALLLAVFLPGFTEAGTLEGTAKNQKGEIVYVEKHTIEKDEKGLNKLIRVEYAKPDGSPFATMTSDFAKSKTVPDTVFEDKRFKTKVVMRISVDVVEFEEFKNEKSVAKKNFPFEESMVASQGFDNFIKLNFAKLDSKPVEFKFGVLENKDFFTLTGYKRASSDQGTEYGIKASSWFLRFFANELRVIYDSKTMQIKSFEGRSNILDDSGNSQDVAIHYKL